MTRLWAAGEPVQVVVRDGGMPVRFRLRGEWHEVAFIANRWRVHTTWWLPEAAMAIPLPRFENRSIAASREYVKLASTGGLLCTLYRDLQDVVPGAEAERDGAMPWYCARVYD